MRFIELKKCDYHRGGYVSINLLINIDDISRVVECIDNSSFTNIVTQDGKIHTLNERYADVIKKIKKIEDEDNK